MLKHRFFPQHSFLVTTVSPTLSSDPNTQQYHYNMYPNDGVKRYWVICDTV